jgi:hypothetical protein
MNDHGVPDRDGSTAGLEAEIAALVAQDPDFEELFKVAREMSERDPEVLPRVLEYARRLLSGEY